MDIPVYGNFVLTDTIPENKNCSICLTPLIYSKFNGKNIALCQNRGIKIHKKYWCSQCSARRLKNFILLEYASPYFEVQNVV